MSTAPSGRRLVRGLMLTGVGIAAILAVGYLISRRTEQMQSTPVPAVSVADTGVIAEAASPVDSTVLVAADSSKRAAPASVAPMPASIPTAAPAVAPAAPRAATTADATKNALPNAAAPTPAPPPSVAVADTGRWEFATANTWVRVRSAPTRESETLRMVDSAQRVRLGPPINGWRPIRVGVDRGWVDPRFFTVVPAPRP
ncbi:MAG: hypothetical protein ACYC5V_01450 [Gemmatimonadaceae bacterium]